MGMFSWICSDTGSALICYDIDICRNKDNYTKKAFLLIPKEFGGGSFKVDNNYDGYGEFYDADGNAHDVYEELAKWNGVAVEDKQTSRCNAIYLHHHHPTEMKYQLKITEYECAYEDAQPSKDDPNQGWGGADTESLLCPVCGCEMDEYEDERYGMCELCYTGESCSDDEDDEDD